MSKEKEFLYVGYYIDTNGQFVLKIGTTNDLKRRAQEHTRNYHKAKNYTMPADQKFTYIWHLPLSKYNTVRYEDSNRQKWKDENIGEFVRNDRFILSKVPKMVEIKIRRIYQIPLPFEGDFCAKLPLDICLLVWYNYPVLH